LCHPHSIARRWLIFQVHFFSSSADPELVRQAAVTNFQKLHDRSMFQVNPGMAVEIDFINKGLFASQYVFLLDNLLI
jgi:hypothetical protein